MSETKRTLSLLHVTLLSAQSLLGASLLWAASMKLFQPIEKLATMWPWTAHMPILVKVTGIIDVLGGLGLLLPMLFKFARRFVSFAAIGVTLLMAGAAIFHMLRGETSSIGINVAFALLAIFIAWGRIRCID